MNKENSPVIKIIGVGGAGGNIVQRMYNEGIKNVTFLVCGTDKHALIKSAIPDKLLLGNAIISCFSSRYVEEAAIQQTNEIKNMLDDGTKMVFIVAGMGGRTGAGAAPVIADIAKEMGIVTVLIVTIPFLFEGKQKILQAINDLEEMSKNVDAYIVLNNESIVDLYEELMLPEVFAKSDEILTSAVKSFSDIISLQGAINLDYVDLETMLKNSGVAVINSGLGRGDNRTSQAISIALQSPLLYNIDIFKAKKLLFQFSFGSLKPMMTKELIEFQEFMANFSPDIEVIWGTSLDERLEDQIKIIILASGLGK